MGGRPAHHVRRAGRLSANTVLQRCDVLGACSEETDRLTRPFATDAMRRAHEVVMGWMRDAGMTVRRDNIGNLRGRYEGARPGPTLLLGSHLDSVRDAGRYDGPLGVLVAIEAVQRLHDHHTRLPFAIEVLAFADEEGLRFGSTYLGSRALTGDFDLDDLNRPDADGVTMAEAIRGFGGDPGGVLDDRWQGGELAGYCEVHIEQGPVLEARGLPVGVVTAISGQARHRLTFTGEAGHAGTVPMELRKDALAAAAEFVLAVEREAKAEPGLVATVGLLEVKPGAANVVPGMAITSLDVRHADDSVRLAISSRLLETAGGIARTRGVELAVQPISKNPSVRCDARLTATMTRAIEELGQVPMSLASGAGHDAVPMSALTGVAMLFVRCKGGVSHHPAESVEVADVGVAIDVLGRFLELLDTGMRPAHAAQA